MDPTRPARLRRAQDAREAAQRRYDLARRDADEKSKAAVDAAMEVTIAEALLADAVADVAREFAGPGLELVAEEQKGEA